MKLITIRSQILSVIDRFKEQYGNRFKEKRIDRDETWGDVYNKLNNLDLETTTAKDVEYIMGNCSWACPKECNECNKRVNEVIEIGQEPDYDSATVLVCEDCLKKALNLITSLKGE